MIRLAKALTRRLWQAALLLVVLAGILTGVTRLVAPELSAYRDQAVQWAEERLGRPVKISTMKVRWRGFGPQLILQNAELPGAAGQAPLLRCAEIRIDFGLLDALLRRTLIPRRITLTGASLRAERRPDGSLAIVGLDPARHDTPPAPGAAALLLPRQLSLRQSELLWEDRLHGTGPQRFHLISARLAQDGEHHQLDITLELPENAGRVRLAADLYGALSRPDSWRGDFYIAGKRLRLPALHNLHPAQLDYRLQQGAADLKLWGHWRAGAVKKLLGKFNLQDLRLARRGATQPLALQQLAGRVQWRKEGPGWQLTLADVQLQRPGQPGQRHNLRLIHRDGALQAELDSLNLADAGAIAALLPLPETLSGALAGLQPRGSVSQLRLNYAPQQAPAAPAWRLSGRFEALHTTPWNGIPGVKNLRGRIEATPAAGGLQLESTQAEADLNGLFRGPLQLQRLSGLLQWERSADGGWRIHSDELIASNADIETRTRLLLEIPPTAEQSPFLDLQTDFANGTVSRTHRYLPTGIMNPQVVDWLDRALVSGRVTSGSCLVRGRLRDFPYKKHEGRFEVLFGVEDLVLDYFPGWPRLEEVSTEVRFLDDRFDAWIIDGKLLNSEVRRAHGWIEQLSRGTPFRLAGEVQGPLDDSLRLLRESPLATDFAASVAGMRAEGGARVTVDLAIPLHDGTAPFRLDGKVAFRQSTLHLDEWQLSLAKMRGELRFDQDGIRAKGIRAKTLGSTLQLDLGASPLMPHATRISARAHLPTATLAARFPGIGLESLGGAADWRLQLDIPNPTAQGDTPPAQILAQSDLVGITLKLPAPLGKEAATPRRFRLSTRLGRSPQQLLRGRYGDLLDFILLLGRDNAGAPRLQRGEVRLGGAQAMLPEHRGLRLHARLESLDLEPWLARFKALPLAGGEGLLSALDIGIRQLRKGDWSLDDVAIALRHEAGQWRGRVASRLFEGEAVIPDDLQQGPIVLRMERIGLTYQPEETPPETPPEPPDTPAAALDPRDFPALRLQSEQLLLNGQALGALTLEIRKTDAGLSLQSARIHSKQLSLDLSGQWLQTPEGPTSDLSFQLDATDAGDLLADMNITRNIRGATAHIKGRLHWPGGPQRIDLRKLGGEIDLDIGKGTVVEADPGIGRIFGLLNLTALQRRLTLDFSDLYEKGFGFDRMLGRFQIEEGDAHTDQFRIDGPAARILISGRAGLATHDLEQVITVAPQISSSVTLATAIANPAAGVALFLAQNLMGKDLDRITSYQYKVTGTWDKPEFSEKKSLFFAPAKEPPAGDTNTE